MGLMGVGFLCQKCFMNVSTFLGKYIWVILEARVACFWKHIILLFSLLIYSDIDPHPNCRSDRSSFMMLLRFFVTYFLAYNEVVRWYFSESDRNQYTKYRIQSQWGMFLNLVDTALSFIVRTFCHLLMVCNQSICPNTSPSSYWPFVAHLQAKTYCVTRWTLIFWWVCRNWKFLLINRMIICLWRGFSLQTLNASFHSISTCHIQVSLYSWSLMSVLVCILIRYRVGFWRLRTVTCR